MRTFCILFLSLLLLAGCAPAAGAPTMPPAECLPPDATPRNTPTRPEPTEPLAVMTPTCAEPTPAPGDAVMDEPPAVTLTSADGFLILYPGNFRWQMSEDSVVLGDGPYPLDPGAAENAPLLHAEDGIVIFECEYMPDTVTLCGWKDPSSGDPNNDGWGIPVEHTDVIPLKSVRFSLSPSLAIYELTATWPQGSATYLFRGSTPFVEN